MSIAINEIRRVFRYNGVALPDVPGMEPQEVRDLYSAQYPELISAEIEAGEVGDGVQEYTFRKAVGTKGRTAAEGERLAALKAAVAVESEGRTDSTGKLVRALSRRGTQERAAPGAPSCCAPGAMGTNAIRLASCRPATCWRRCHDGLGAAPHRPQVPLTIAPGPLLAANAKVSRFLIEAEAFDEDDIPATWSDSSMRAGRRSMAGSNARSAHCTASRRALPCIWFPRW
jgi:PRTRC genetic system protein C